MINPEVVELIQQGRLDDAARTWTTNIVNYVELDDLNRTTEIMGQQFAEERATELFWIASAFAKEEKWEEARQFASLSATVNKPSHGNIEMALAMFMLPPTSSPKSKAFQEQLFDAIEKDMDAFMVQAILADKDALQDMIQQAARQAQKTHVKQSSGCGFTLIAILFVFLAALPFFSLTI